MSTARALTLGCTFKELGLAPWLISSCNSLGLLQPSAIQHKAIPPTLAGLNVLGVAETGSGKTAAFALPLLQTLFEDPYGIFALVVTPSRELAIQIGRLVCILGTPQKVRVSCAIGGVEFVSQSSSIMNRHPHVLIGTPGRLAEFLDSCVLETMVRCVRTLVLDEADRLLSDSICVDIQRILTVVNQGGQLLSQHQLLLYSATRTRRLEAFSNALCTTKIMCSSSMDIPENLIQEYVLCPNRTKMSHLLQLLLVFQLEHGRADDSWKIQASLDRSDPRWMPRSAIIFVQTCRRVSEVHSFLMHVSIDCSCLHSNMTQQRRVTLLGNFQQKNSRVLICTDVLTSAS